MNKPSDNSFNQQRISGWYTIMTPRKIIITFLILGFIYLILGIVALANFLSSFNYERFYTFEETALTSFPLKISSTLKKPIIVQYELTAFYQNHQRFLSGNNFCTSKNCGNASSTLILHSVFNDTFSVLDPDNNEIKIDRSDIVFDSDRKREDFKNLTDEQIVWAKIASLPTFFKLYGVIKQDLKPGEYTVEIANNYPLPELSKKAVVISRISTTFGGRNKFVGIILIAVGGITILMGAVFILIELRCERKLGEYHEMFDPDMADTSLQGESEEKKYYQLPLYVLSTENAAKELSGK